MCIIYYEIVLLKVCGFVRKMIYFLCLNGAVAQLVRASACHAEGRGFESLQPRQMVENIQNTKNLDVFSCTMSWKEAAIRYAVAEYLGKDISFEITNSPYPNISKIAGTTISTNHEVLKEYANMVNELLFPNIIRNNS